MSGTNDFKAFAGSSGANVLSQADWLALAALTSGFQSGTAQSAACNKAWRQSSIIAAVIGQFIVDLTGQNAIDDGTSATLLANFKSAVQAQSASIVGQSANLAMLISSASSSATMTADQVIVASSLSGQSYRVSNLNSTINLATVGAGGMDIGVAPNSGFVALYVIYNPLTDARALLAVDATTSLASSTYSGAHMPSGYTASALESVWPTDSMGRFVVGTQSNRRIDITPTTVLSTNTAQATITPLSVSSVIPKNARFVSGTMSVSSTSSSQNTSLILYPMNANVGIEGVNNSVAAAGGVSAVFRDMAITTSQTLYYTATESSGTPTFTATITNYQI